MSEETWRFPAAESRRPGVQASGRQSTAVGTQCGRGSALFCGSWKLVLTDIPAPDLRVSPPLVCAQDPGRTAAATGGDTEEKKLSKSQQLKKVFQEYGAVGVSVHIGISLVSLGMFYTVVSSGVDMSAILLKLGFKESLVQSKVAAGTSTFVVAYTIHKLFAPVRISITLVSVPLIVRYFRKVGFFKPPAAKS
ncbi:PREDICTED: protein FAM210B [Miniopterus natalensis]|uniref:protein FAM210B n=1 Tax=Miniopterus natalensis TaxID=291302 RepID=UPI0007A6C2C4|nr:PREDICTED: protein FAM210B [Miniopterus natalensis]